MASGCSWSVVVVFACFIGSSLAANFVSNALGSNMVLQRAPLQASLWGWSKQAGASVTVTLQGTVYKGTADSTGRWEIHLPPQQASTTGVTLTVASSAGEAQALSNVLFGDVWMCSGQSNMQMTVSMVFNATAEIANAANYPNIRLFTVGQGNISLTPLTEFGSIVQPWSVASPSSVGGKDWAYFSAACRFFGKDLYDRLQIPIGLVSTNWGGTYVQAWSSPDALKKCGTTNEKPIGGTQVNPNQPSVLWNAMIVPLLTMRSRGIHGGGGFRVILILLLGAIWYQGEANVGQPTYYSCEFPAMITDWRTKWGEDASTFQFDFVQLAAYTEGNPGTALADLRLSQEAALALPYVGQASAVDLGDLGSPAGNIHPRDKQDVGMRLAWNALALAYNQNVQYLGPTFSSLSFRQGTTSVAVVSFVPSSIGTGLKTAAASCPAAVGNANCAWFDVQSDDGQWHNATVAIVGNTVELSVTLAAGRRATGARFGYAEWPVCTVFNGNGLPLLPFTSSTLDNKQPILVN